MEKEKMAIKHQFFAKWITSNICAYSYNNKLHKKFESTNFNWQKISLIFLSWHLKQSMTTKQYTTITNAFSTFLKLQIQKLIMWLNLYFLYD